MHDMATTARARAEAGARYLTGRLGPDWVDGVDQDTLDIAYGDRCVLGQLESSGRIRGIRAMYMRIRHRDEITSGRSWFHNTQYHIAAVVLGLSSEDCIRLGFLTDSERVSGVNSYSLNDAWRQVMTPMVRARQPAEAERVPVA